MIKKEEEINFYKSIYMLTFGKEAGFFYLNDIDTILSFLKEKYSGDNLQVRVMLLSKLLYFDSDLNPDLKKDLRLKSEKLSAFNLPLQE